MRIFKNSRPTMGQVFTRKLTYLVTLFMVISLAIYGYSEQFARGAVPEIDYPVLIPRSESPSVSWEQIVPSSHLVYHPCFEDYQCARLELPMDWKRTDGKGSKIALAVIRLPAKVPVTDARYGGPVIINPGGPGGSGVSYVLTDGKQIQGIVDSEGSANMGVGKHTAAPGKYFDIMSFDTRGTNNTTPPFSCFQDSATRKEFLSQQDAEGMPGSSDLAFDNFWARSASVGITCSQAAEESNLKGEEWIGHHMNTPPSVADMVALIERHGEWREKETKALLQPTHQKSDVNAIRLRNRWKRGKEKLLYWGISYGSLLGMTFATMHPGRVQRVVLDGVLDASDYYAGGWLTSIQDADQAFESFFEYCHEAGPAQCALAHGDSLVDMKLRVDELVEKLKTNPVPVPGSATRPPDIITYTDVKTTITSALYQPMELFETLAQLLADLSRNNGSSFADFKYQGAAATCQGPDQLAIVAGDNMFEAQGSIICTDGRSIDGISKDKYRQYWKTLYEQSKTIGDEWSQIRLACIKWKPRPTWEFNGPVAGHTSYPLLFIGNTYDPVTPLRNAVKMARSFPRSVVLQQNSVGHCSYTGPSSCTDQSIRRYFQSGVLPRRGTICEVDKRPFGLPPAVKN
ncbi:hypothetical protein P170DRAFT_459762 [Aspergillus steynii IBT 23096]|uniref:Proteinase n=1 Tax=Aspergillus steynii IBT 23096 TaxID=1392250 RepID=A0A2I2FRT1_9EURO|nr:uncharacterized protein P170DRAFT_459762 [Aspergillus steynii IBT 23096]PLB43319.1 hypothetical protein P170DRAFT_459762 [Aspergillus steynii IBT 23096]